MATKVKKEYGVVACHGSKELKLQKLSDGRLALVSYKDGMSVRVTEISDNEAEALRYMLEDYLDYKTPKCEDNAIIKSLTSLPAGDVNYQTALRNATEEEITKAIEIMKSNGGKNATRIKYCENQLSKGKKKAEPKAEPKIEEEPKEECKVIQFPKAKPEIIKLVTDGDHTYEECEKKLGAEREIFTDPDSQYVIDGLLELCKVDGDFRNNVMREEKTYGGFMKYMYKVAKDGYCIKYDNVGWLDRDSGLGLAIDYYNHDEKEAEARKKRLDEAIKKTKTNKKGGKANGNNVGKKKKRTTGQIRELCV